MCVSLSQNSHTIARCVCNLVGNPFIYWQSGFITLSRSCNRRLYTQTWFLITHLFRKPLLHWHLRHRPLSHYYHTLGIQLSQCASGSSVYSRNPFSMLPLSGAYGETSHTFLTVIGQVCIKRLVARKRKKGKLNCHWM